MSTRERSLEINEDLEFQRREWRVQRLAWWLLAGFVVAAALGVFGSGPLSHAAVEDATGALRVEYERFLRVGSPHRLSIRARTSGSETPTGFRLVMNRTYFDAMQVDRVLPEPLEVAIGPEDVTLRFAPAASGEFTIVIDSEPLQAGRHRAEFRASTGGAVGIGQLTYF